MKSFKFFALVMALLIAIISPVSAKKEKKTCNENEAGTK